MFYQHELFLLLTTLLSATDWAFLFELCLFSQQLTNIHILPFLSHALCFYRMCKNLKRLTYRSGMNQLFFTRFLILCSLHPRFHELLTSKTPTAADTNKSKSVHLQEIGLCTYPTKVKRIINRLRHIDNCVYHQVEQSKGLRMCFIRISESRAILFMNNIN